MAAAAKSLPAMEERVAAVRRFARFYTRRIGVLQDHFLQSPFSLAEARVLYELAHRDKPTATELAAGLDLDPGYLSRILRGFEERGFVAKTRSPDDRRQSRLAITAKGRMAFAPLERRSQDDVAAMLGALPSAEQDRVVAAMGAIERLIGGRDDAAPSYVLRPPAPGDLGWVVARHGALYAQEYGWGTSFEGLCAEIVAQYVKTHDPARARCCRTRSPSCVCSSSTRRRAGSASGRGWSTNASVSRAPPATARSACGRAACSSMRAASTKAPGSSARRRSRMRSTA